MKTFYQFLENINSSLVKIDMESLKKSLAKKIEDFFIDYEDKTEKLKNFKLDLNYQILTKIGKMIYGIGNGRYLAKVDIKFLMLQNIYGII